MQLLAGARRSNATDPDEDCDVRDDPVHLRLRARRLRDRGHRGGPSAAPAATASSAAATSSGRGGSEIQLRYEKRNVLGFATDFAARPRPRRTGASRRPGSTDQAFGITTEERGCGPSRHLQPDGLGRPADLHQLPEREPHLLLQQPGLRALHRRLRGPGRAARARPVLGARHPHRWSPATHQDRLLPARHVGPRRRSASGGLIAPDHVPLQPGLLGDVRHRGLLRRSRARSQIPFRQPLLGQHRRRLQGRQPLRRPLARSPSATRSSCCSGTRF